MQETPTETFPEHIYALASEQHVGVPLRSCRRIISRAQWIFVLAWMLFGGLILALGIWAYIVDRHRADRSSCPSCSIALQREINQTNNELIMNDMQNIIGSFTQFLLVPLGVFCIFGYTRRKWPIYVCSEGLLAKQKKGKIEVIRWDEVERVYWKKGQMGFLSYTELEKGWDIQHIDNREVIFEYVENQVIPRLLERARTQYQITEYVQFGCLAIDSDGLINRSPIVVKWNEEKRIVSWQDLEDISCEAGLLSIKIQGQWRSWDGGARSQRSIKSIVPNPPIYATLAREILQMKAQGQE